MDQTKGLPTGFDEGIADDDTIGVEAGVGEGEGEVEATTAMKLMKLETREKRILEGLYSILVLNVVFFLLMIFFFFFFFLNFGERNESSCLGR